MISLEAAKKLKDAGLPWEPKEGDWYYDVAGENELKLLHSRTDTLWAKLQCEHEPILNREFIVSAPRLDQMLQEIEKRGWRWILIKKLIYRCYLTGADKNDPGVFRSPDTPEDAPAQALEWILKGGGVR